MHRKVKKQRILRQEALNVIRRNPRGQGQIQPLRYGEVAPVSGARSYGLRKLFQISFVVQICFYLLCYCHYMISSQFTDSKINISFHIAV